MTNFHVKYTLTDDSVVESDIYDYEGDIASLTNDLIALDFTTHLSRSGKSATIVNNKFIKTVEVTEV